MYLSPRKQLFVDTASELFGAGSILTKSQVKEASEIRREHLKEQLNDKKRT